jgi:riboflavin synthase
MFTGIVEAVGEVREVQPRGADAGVIIGTGELDLADVKIGDSIAVNGCCLTVVELTRQAFRVDVSRETLERTIGFEAGARVNLEKALRASDRLGGHLVTGHVDGLGEVTLWEPVGESWRLEVRVPTELARYLARKGSITVNGVSLTVNKVENDRFEVNLIPHTLEVTNLKSLSLGGRVNIEVDLLARYLERLLQGQEGTSHP